MNWYKLQIFSLLTILRPNILIPFSIRSVVASEETNTCQPHSTEGTNHSHLSRRSGIIYKLLGLFYKHLCNWLTDSFDDPFSPNLPDTFITWNFEWLFTSLHGTHVTCHVSCVMCRMSDVFFLSQSGGPIWWRVCYQRGLPRLVFPFFK